MECPCKVFFISVFLQDHDAILERVLYSFSLAILLLIISLHNKLLSLTLLASSVVVLWSSISYISKELYKSHHIYDTTVRKLKCQDPFFMLPMIDVVGIRPFYSDTSPSNYRLGHLHCPRSQLYFGCY